MIGNEDQPPLSCHHAFSSNEKKTLLVLQLHHCRNQIIVTWHTFAISKIYFLSRNLNRHVWTKSCFTYMQIFASPKYAWSRKPIVLHRKARYRCHVTKHCSFCELCMWHYTLRACQTPVMKWQQWCVCMFCSEGTAEMCGLSRPLRLYNIYQPWPAVSFKTDFLFLCNVCHHWRRVAVIWSF